MNLESSRTSSVHNVYLEAFSNGGLVLGVAFAIFVLSPFIIWRRRRKETSASEDNVAMWLPYLSICLIFVVSVEHVVLNFVVFVFWGLMFGSLKGNAPPRKPRNNLRWLVSIIGVVLVVIGLAVAIRPFAAALKAKDASEAIDASTRLRDLKAATRWMGSEPAYWLALGDQQLALGDYENASDSLWKSMEKSAFSGAVAPQVARVFAQIGDIERSLSTIEESALNDPYAPQMRSELSQLLLEIEEALRAESITVMDIRIAEIRQSTGL